jgi:hypothetical protein
MAPKLELAFTMRSYVSIEQNVSIGAVKGGLIRSVSPITHGYIKGPGLDAKVLSGGADVSLVRYQLDRKNIGGHDPNAFQFDPTTNVSHLDVRASARTEDGESFYINYVGVMKSDAILSAILRGEEAKTTNFGDHEWFSSLRIETSSEALKWAETTLFIGRGRCIVEEDGTAAEYEIYKVVN